MSQKLPNPPPAGIPQEPAPVASYMDASVAAELIGQTILLTVDNWFYAPDGRQYRAVFGTLRGVHTAEKTLGVRPNGKSSNWYLEIGNLVIAGCQIHYALRCTGFNSGPAPDFTISEKGITLFDRPCNVYDANNEPRS